MVKMDIMNIPDELRKCIPRHIAIITDGNRRWAKGKGLPPSLGHYEGVERVKEITKACLEARVEILTWYCFSTENWKRNSNEINTLMKIFTMFLKEWKQKAHDQGICIKHIGSFDKLPNKLISEIKASVDLTKDNSRMTINLALNYGGRYEIITGVKDIIKDVQSGKLMPEHIREDVFNNYLTTKYEPYPDIVIRTSGEKRLSNFLLWQTSKSYIYISDVLWPEFHVHKLWEALLDYAEQRKFT